MERHIYFILLVSALCPLSSCLYHQYYFVNMNMNWTEAQSYCRQNYIDLATIDSTEEMNGLISSVDTGYTGAAWIGLYFDENGWQWSLDGSRLYSNGEMTYTNWGSFQPNADWKTQSCVLIFVSGVWLYIPCFNVGYFVCYNGNASANQTYIVVTEFKNWTDSQYYCRQHYTDLASIRNQTENQRIQSLVAIYGAAWIGLYRDTWKWSDGENATFLAWQTGKPDNTLGTETCVVQVLSGEQKWSNADCDGTYPFFCLRGTSTTQPATTQPSTTHLTSTDTSTSQSASTDTSTNQPANGAIFTTNSVPTDTSTMKSTTVPNGARPVCVSVILFSTSFLSCAPWL